MARTYRTLPIRYCGKCDKPYRDNMVKGNTESCECNYYHNGYTLESTCFDHKPWYKPPKEFKQSQRQQFRAQCKQALFNKVYKGKEYTPPVNKKTDIWDWT